MRWCWLILSLFSVQLMFAQEEQVYLRTEKKSSTIYLPRNKDSYTVEYYVKHKVYFKKDNEIIPKDEFEQIKKEAKADKSVKFMDLTACHPYITRVRFEGTRLAELQVIKDKSKKEIGFELYQLGIANTTPEYSIKAFEDSAEYETSCFEAFRKELDKEKAQYLEKINKIYTQKKAYLKHLEKKNIEVDKEWIHTFMRQLKYCDTDAQSLALLIENHTEVFVNYLDDMDEKIFRTLKYVARRMPDDVYVKGLKDSLKELGVKSKRSKIIIKRLKAKKMDLE